MADTPPRRSRRPSDDRKDATFPLIPFLIGVVILGFVIGAGLSIAGRHGSSPEVATAPVVTAEPTQTPGPTLAPLATARPLPTRTPPGAMRTAAHDTPMPKAGVAHVALASLPPSAQPTSMRTGAAAIATPFVVATHHPAPITIAKTSPPEIVPKTPAAIVTKAQPTVVPSVPTPAPSLAPATSIDADSDFGRLSANVVRQYLRALARGDTQSAASAFVPGAPNNAFPERPILDSSAQIGSISARGSNDTQTVNAVISTSNGTYVGTYTVHKTATGAAVIVSHTISKG